MQIILMGICFAIKPLTGMGQSFNKYNDNGFDPIQRQLYKPGNNIHTSIKPYRLDEINTFINSDSVIQRDLKKPKGKLNIYQRFFHDDFLKWTNSNDPIEIRVNPLFNFELGKESSEGKNTWVNTRGIMIDGKIGKNLSFYADFYENQGVFGGYMDNYIKNRKVVPGQGRIKNFKDIGYDYSQATGYFSYNAGSYFNLQLGFGKNFLGDGYRSLLLSDNTYSYPFFKMTSTFWKIKYLLIISQFQNIDVERSTGVERFPSKYGAFHYLSWNIGKRISLGFFESVIWAAEDEIGHRGLDMNYLIPIIFYRPVEYGLGSPDNMTMGANLKILLWNDAAFYAQYVMGEFKLDEIFSGEKWWGNKQGFQFGLKSYNFLGVNNLDVQTEYNQVRPYTYSHYFPITSYSHFNQELAHPLGANFREIISILRYRQGRLQIELKGMYAIKGFDFDDDVSYGGNIFISNDRRTGSHGHILGQGLKTNILNGSGEISYLINPKNNMNIGIGFRHRSFTNDINSDNNSLIYFALRTSLRNLYYDF